MSLVATSIDQILQNFYSLSRLKRYSQNQIFESFSTHFQKLNGANCFLIGGCLVDILLPDELIEFTQIMPRRIAKSWCLTINTLLCQESSRMTLSNSPEFSQTDSGDRLTFQTQSAGQKSSKNIRIETVEFNVNHDFVVVTVGQEKFKLRANNLNSIFLAAVLEEFTNLIGNRNLVKRSLLLIKLWTSYEARKYSTTDLPSIFSHDAMVVLTLCVFTSPQQKHMKIDHPLRALQYFLEIMSTVDWKHQQVTVFGIEPIRSAFFSAPAGASADLDRDNENLMNLASIVHPFAQRFRDNFILGDESLTVGGLSESDPLIQTKDHGSAGAVCGIIVADPVQPTRNICAQKHHDADSLRKVFSSGLEDMEDLFMKAPCDRDDSIGEEKNPVNAFLFLTIQKANSLKDHDIRNMQGLFSGLVLDSTSKSTPMKADLGDTKFPDSLASSIQYIAFLVKHTEMVATNKMDADVLIHMVIQVLTQHGPLPIGEIGKQLQTTTGNSDLPRIIKKMFSGLKKFISSYPQLFYFEANHNFNPKVHMNLAECAPEVTARGSIPCPLPQSSTGSPPQQMLQASQMSQGSLLPPAMIGMHDMREPPLQQQYLILPPTSQPKAQQPIWENWDEHGSSAYRNQGPGSVMSSRQQNTFPRDYNKEGSGHYNSSGHNNAANNYYEDDNEYFDDERYNVHGYQDAAYHQPQPPSHSYPPPPNLPYPSHSQSQSQSHQQAHYSQKSAQGFYPAAGPKHPYPRGQPPSGPMSGRDIHNNSVSQHGMQYNNNVQDFHHHHQPEQRMHGYPQQRIFK